MRYIITFFFFFIALIAYVQSPNATIADTIQAQKWLEDGLQAQNEGDYSKAIELIQKSIKAFEVYPQSKGLGDAYNSMYFAYAYSGDWKTALKYSKIHYQYCIDMNIPAKETGDGLNDIAYIFGELKNIDSTIHYYLKAIEIYEKADTLPNKDLGLAHHNLSFQYKDYGYLEKSLIHARKAYDYWIENEPEVSSYIASMYSNMGALYGDLNALDLYKDYLEKSVTISLELEGENGFQYAMGIANLAYYYNLVEEYETALEHGFKAIKIFKKYTDKTRSLATTYSNLAESYEGLGKLTESEAAYQKAIEVSPNKVDTYVNLFSLYLNNDQVAKYDDILKEKDRIEKMAIEINSPYLALFYANISTVYSRKEQFDEALKYMNYAMNLSTGEFKIAKADPEKEMKITNVSNNGISLKVFSGRFQLTKRHYDYTQNIEDLKLAFDQGLFSVELYEKHHKQIPYVQKSKTVETKEVYELVIDLAYLLYEKTDDIQYFEKAFQLSEQFKGNEILIGLNDAKAKTQLNLPLALLKKEQDIKVKWNYAKTQFFEAKQGPDANLLSKRTKEMTHWQHEYEALMEVLKKEYPNYFDLKYKKANVTIKDIQKQILESQQVLVEYFVGENAVYSWQIEKDNISFYKKEQTSDSLEVLVENLRHSVTDNNARMNNPKIAYSNYISSASQLYTILLKDIIKLDNHEQLLIVPDGILNGLPFEILLIDLDKSGELSYKQLPYLIKNISVSYTSATKLLLQKRNSKASSFLAAFAPEYAKFAKSDTTQSKQLAELVRDNEAQLLGGLKEAATISELYEGEAFTHQEASEENFKKKASNYQILHLSMHALIDKEYPLRSHLVFEPKPSKEDNRLYLSEIYNMNIPADMVVLSACNSGFGQVRTGYGVQSLGNAFNYAGTASTVMSLWKVPDQSTAPLMIGFYNELKKKFRKDASLRKAKLNYLDNAVADELAHPYYWAGFIASGDMSPIEKRRNFNYWWLFGALGMFGIVLLFLRLKKK